MKVDILYVFLLIAAVLFFVMVFNKPQEKIVIKEVVEETPRPYWTYIYPNYWERAPRDNTYYNPYYYDPYFSYPYYIGPWWYGGSGSGYSGGIRTGYGGRGGHHGGGGGRHGGK